MAVLTSQKKESLNRRARFGFQVDKGGRQQQKKDRAQCHAYCRTRDLLGNRSSRRPTPIISIEQLGQWEDPFIESPLLLPRRVKLLKRPRASARSRRAAACPTPSGVVKSWRKLLESNVTGRPSLGSRGSFKEPYEALTGYVDCILVPFLRVRP